MSKIWVLIIGTCALGLDDPCTFGDPVVMPDYETCVSEMNKAADYYAELDKDPAVGFAGICSEAIIAEK